MVITFFKLNLSSLDVCRQLPLNLSKVYCHRRVDMNEFVAQKSRLLARHNAQVQMSHEDSVLEPTFIQKQHCKPQVTGQ